MKGRSDYRIIDHAPLRTHDPVPPVNFAPYVFFFPSSSQTITYSPSVSLTAQSQRWALAWVGKQLRGEGVDDGGENWLEIDSPSGARTVAALVPAFVAAQWTIMTRLSEGCTVIDIWGDTINDPIDQKGYRRARDWDGVDDKQRKESGQSNAIEPSQGAKRCLRHASASSCDVVMKVLDVTKCDVDGLDDEQRMTVTVSEDELEQATNGA
ncbi:hypothetical protein BDQ17DRAFT_1336054 [Cyathus striatus]|nr:hypothetical protein BDQ17DRAFT_1336054 [Cyathus striatus]